MPQGSRSAALLADMHSTSPRIPGPRKGSEGPIAKATPSHSPVVSDQTKRTTTNGPLPSPLLGRVRLRRVVGAVGSALWEGSGCAYGPHSSLGSAGSVVPSPGPPFADPHYFSLPRAPRCCRAESCQGQRRLGCRWPAACWVQGQSCPMALHHQSHPPGPHHPNCPSEPPR